MTDPLYAVQNRIRSNGFLTPVLHRIRKDDLSNHFIHLNALRIIQFAETGKCEDEIPGLLEGMRVLGCNDPEGYVEKARNEFSRELMPSTRERDW